ncbi:putative membrane protein YdbT with pleckstrin-like domain [Streptosporangium becharense]|uniref:Putative membrane protein YdbT with pleckstrin-like domain n=1 Tax=Streptosporangium becharense TaxID=1816182 RepID=A0A7W9IF79_9ACTN|nr:PH domain-containing protein [Streptosporangium becharense]MBB2909649.1 putative membrane protein YdbT with pleckstrin-like domain [Streptosporangium becharense]MBB5819395.1 putative membrane protein YdbT with pleckstrin-like domain [Streptosporangium becharense]
MGLPDHQMTEGERRIRSFRPHWKRLIVPFLAMILIIVASGAAMFFMPAFEYASYALLAVAVITVGLLTVWSFVPYLRWKNTAYVLTSHRFTISTGVLGKSVDDIPMSKVTTVSADQTLLERMLGCGTLVIESAGDQGRVTLRDIPHIQDVRAELFRALDEAADEELSERGGR